MERYEYLSLQAAPLFFRLKVPQKMVDKQPAQTTIDRRATSGVSMKYSVNMRKFISRLMAGPLELPCATANFFSEQLDGNVVDLDAILIRLGGDKELLRDFAAIFLEDSPRVMSKLDDGLAAHDLDQVRHAAHALKGLASNFTAKSFCKVASEIETSANADNIINAKTNKPAL